MSLEVVLAVLLVVAGLAAVALMSLYDKKPRVRSVALTGALGVLNELYAPSAKNASIIVEEQREAVKPKPSPEDKP
ncbi:MAG: hypothetical protein RL719_824 [Actinomycetota bacterium]